MGVITPKVAERIVKGREYPETVRALAEKWGPIFGVDPSWIISHCYVESTNRPIPVPQNGPARGLMQIKPPTANDIARLLGAVAKKDKRVRDVLASSWRGQPEEDLLNPELNLMFGTFYIGYIKRKLEAQFPELESDENEQEIVAAAYNQGPGAVRKALRSGEFKPTPPMNVYIAKIEDAKEKGYA